MSFGMRISFLLLLILTIQSRAFALDHNDEATTSGEVRQTVDDANSAEQKRIQDDRNFQAVKAKMKSASAKEENQNIVRTRDTEDQTKLGTKLVPTLNFITRRYPTVVVEANEESSLKSKQVLSATEWIERNKQLEAFEHFAAQKTLNEALKDLKKENVDVKVGPIIEAKNKFVVELNDEQAKMAYLVALFRLEKEAEIARFDPLEAGRNAAALSKAQLDSSLSGATDFTSNPLSQLDFNNLSRNYLDLAAKQIANATENPESSLAGGLKITSPFSTNTELNSLFQQALNTINTTDAANNGADQLSAFQKLINSKAFLENGASLLGKDGANALVSAVQAAELLSKTGGKLNGTATSFLADAFNLGTGTGAPPCIGCVEGKNSAQVSAAENYKGAGENAAATTVAWINEANEIADTASRNKMLSPKEISYLIKGRTELDKLIIDLKNYKSVGVLDIVKIPSPKSIARDYKEAAEIAAGILFLVRQRKIKTNEEPAIAADIKALRLSASDNLEKLKKAQNPARMELVLRDFFESKEQAPVRALWRKHEEKNFKKLRSATAQIIMTRAMALIKLPSFEKVTLERATLAYLVGRAMKNIQEREEKNQKEKDIRLGLKFLPTPAMQGDKAKAEPPKAPATRYPSFIDEENEN
jgi:hypothetical protein